MENKKHILIFGNQELEFDSLPLRVLPELKRLFPKIRFEIKDPNEEFEIPEELTIIDTVRGIEEVKIFSDLKNFTNHPHISLHDFDLWSQLKFLQKLGKLKKIKIIGVPADIPEKEALEKISAIINS